jgi:hypothetical protein
MVAWINLHDMDREERSYSRLDIKCGQISGINSQLGILVINKPRRKTWKASYSSRCGYLLIKSSQFCVLDQRPIYVRCSLPFLTVITMRCNLFQSSRNAAIMSKTMSVSCSYSSHRSSRRIFPVQFRENVSKSSMHDVLRIDFRTLIL